MSVYFEDHSIEAGHGRRSLRAGAAMLIARLVITAVQLATILVLARILSPEDYGLVSMVTALTLFAPLLVSLGTPDAVVQRPRITEKEISTLFWISMAVGLIVAIVMVACSPLIARFYNEPRLVWITQISALAFVVSALSCHHTTLLRRAMKFKELAVVEAGANLLSAGGAIAMALYGFEYWALVLRPIMLTSFIAIGVWLRCRWLPGRPGMSVGTKEILRQGLHNAGFVVTDYVAGSSDRIAIGHRSGPIQLGYYQNAMFIFDNLSALLVVPAHNVAVAGLGKAQNDRDELLRLWRKALLMLEFYAMPAFGILAVTGQDLVVVLFGSKWSQAGVLVSILGMRGIPYAVERTLGWLHVSAGRMDRWMRWGLAAMCVQLVALFCGLPFGAIGVAVALAACTYLLFIPAVAYSGRPFGITAADVIAVVWRPMAGALMAVAIGLLLRLTSLADMPSIVRIVVSALVYTTVYLVVVVGFLGQRMPLQVVAGLIKDALPARLGRHLESWRFLKPRNER